MRISTLDTRPDATLVRSLDQFERQFSYPLGRAQSFRVLHGDDYGLFFRAMGEARCFIAEKDGEIIGTLAVVVRRIQLPDGTEKNVGYLGNLKISPCARGGRALFRLADAAATWIQKSATAYFGVVMDGTALTPDYYTGRAGLPPFAPVGRVVVIRLPTSGASSIPDPMVSEAEPDVAMDCFRQLSIGRFATRCEQPSARSLLTPVWLVRKDGSACGCVEDTRRAKRLIGNDGVEMITGHLSCFAYKNIESGVALIRTAIGRAGLLGHPALFVALAEADSPEILAEFGGQDVKRAPATIFAYGLTRNMEWNLNTAEI
jgi:hypothetical protein